ncbi:hypothetical protein ACFPM7_22135 [Actinokineospora guangxiensis]|uniref:Uncharacterized protein n=1 Tax=Actinokineospora guangxiensis TaxID=1490288 RepID=A0ABW0EV35_9PSEU
MTRAEDVTTRHEDVGRVPRRRGAVNGFLVVLLGLWGATVPFFGPYLGLPYGFDDAWVFTGERALLNVLPGVVVILGGLGLIGSARSTGGVFWGWLAAVGGAWFAVGPTVSTVWTGGAPAVGEPLAASAGVRAFTELVYHVGLGALIVFLAAVALGRFTAGTGRVVAEVPEQDRGLHDRDGHLRDTSADKRDSDLDTYGQDGHIRDANSTDSTTDRLRTGADRSGPETSVLHRPTGTVRDGAHTPDAHTPDTHARDTHARDAYNQGAYDQAAQDGKHRVPNQPR